MTPTDEAARIIRAVLFREARYLSSRGVRDLREALALLEAGKEAQPVEYVAVEEDDPRFAAWRREYRRRR